MPLESKLFITGGSGFLGWNLARLASAMHDVSFSYHHHALTIDECQDYHLNLQNRKEMEAVVEEIEPEIIIHTAALANVDICENHRSKAHELNVTATEHLVKCAEDCGARFVYISTDLVFDGQTGNYVETDTPRPLNYYGETKLQAEQVVQAESSNYLIARMALMYGNSNGINGCFTDWVRRRLNQGQSLPLFTDQYRTPLFVRDGARALLELLEQPVKNEIFHLAGRERLNRYAFGQKFARIFGYTEQGLEPIKMHDLDFKAERGSDCSLKTDKIQQYLSFPLSDVETGLQKMKQERS